MATQDLTRLPQWARQRIQTLEANIEYYEARLAEGPVDSDTFADPHSETACRPLGKGVLIEFAVSTREDGWSKQYIQASRLNDGSVEVRASRKLSIEPQANNSIIVRNVQS